MGYYTRKRAAFLHLYLIFCPRRRCDSVLVGAAVPLVLRKLENRDENVFLGPAILTVGRLKVDKEEQSLVEEKVLEWPLAHVADPPRLPEEEFVLV
jgi:hypothetical protein